MNKKLLKQIWNERRSNSWLFIELLLVSVVLFVVVDYMYVNLSTYFSPKGFDISNTYRVVISELTDKSPNFIPNQTFEQRNADYLEMTERLHRRPEIEAVALSHNSFPYNGSNNGMKLKVDTFNINNYTIFRQVNPDFFRVFRYEGANGETPEQLAELLKDGVVMASDNIFESKYGKKTTEFIGREFKCSEDTSRTYRMVASLQPIRYDDFSQTCYSRSSLFLLDVNKWAGSEVCVRVKEGQTADFIQRLKSDAPKQFRVGNQFISDILSFEDIRHAYQMGNWIEMRNYLIGMGFLLVNIFLGLFGTFWFRTQQRKSEMALMMAMGSNKNNVFKRLLSEGLLLLVLATPLAMIVDYHMAKAELTQWMNFTTLEIGRYFITVTITFVLIALMIVSGIWFPARKAMKIHPAEALRDE